MDFSVTDAIALGMFFCIAGKRAHVLLKLSVGFDVDSRFS